MRRALKFLFAFLVLVVVAAIAAMLLISRERIVALAADQVRAATGHELDTPAGTLESASLDARLTLKGGNRIDLSGLTLRLDRTTMTGDAGANREDLAALPGLPTSEAEDGVDEDLSVPSPQYTPAPEPEQPAATVWPEPEPEIVPEPAPVLQPEPEPVLQPQAEPEPEKGAPEPKRERRGTGRHADEQPRRRSDKDGGLSPEQIRKGSEK